MWVTALWNLLGLEGVMYCFCYTLRMLIYIPHSIFTASGGYLVEDIFTEEESLELDAGGQTQSQHESQSVQEASQSVQEASQSVQEANYLWTRPATLLLIAEYKTFLDKLEKGKIKKKLVWESISKTLTNKGHKHNPSQCESRFKTLQRGLKNVTDHNKKSGNDKKSHPYEAELAFLSMKPNFTPKYLKGSESSSISQSPSSDEQSTSKPHKRSAEVPLEDDPESDDHDDGDDVEDKNHKSGI